MSSSISTQVTPSSATGSTIAAEVEADYLAVLGRGADPIGLANAVAALGGGETEAQFRAGLAQSAEARADINADYKAVFGRAADPPGLANSQAALANGETLAQLRSGYATSAEARSDIQSLYEKELGRAAEPTGLAFWQNSLAGRTTLSQVAAAIAQSPEAATDIQALFTAELGRAAEAAGQAYWAGQLPTLGLAGVRSAIAETVEAQTLLRAIAGPGSSAATLARITALLAGGESLAAIRASFVATPTAPAAPVIAGLTAATDTGLSPTDGITDDTTPTLTGTAPAGSSVQVTIAGSAQTVTADSTGQWNLQVATPLADGQFTATATDTQGSQTSAASAPYVFTIDTTAPAAPTLNTPAASATAITGTAEPGSTVAVFDNATLLGTTVAAAGTGQFSLAATLGSGVNLLTADATDLAGNTGPSSSPISVSGTLLQPTIALAASDQQGTAAAPAATAGTVTIVGSAGAGDTVTLSEPGGTLSTIAAANNTYTLAGVAITPGANALTVTETDGAGDTGTGSTTITGQAAATSGPDVVLQWVNITRNAIATDADAPTVAARTLAIESLSVYDTLAAINGTASFAVTMTAPADANVTAAIAAAADAALDSLYPTQAANFDATLADQLAALPDGQGKTDGVALGRAIAAAEVALRADDGSDDNVTDYGSDTPGQWRPTPYAYSAATTPQFANVTPFLLQSPDQFRAPSPPALDSQQYADAVNQVEAIGAADSTTRTADETQIAKFWNGQTGTDTPAGEWNNIASVVAQNAGDSVAQDARLFAELNVTLADAAISAWNNKFYYNLWRPVSAIRDADTDGNAATTADPTWTSLLTTPAFPDYAEGHGAMSGAAAQVLESVFGDDTSFTVDSQSLAGVTRSYTSFSEAASEAAESRVYGGIHFQFSADAGLALGAQVGSYDVAAFSLASDTPPTVRLAPTLSAVTDASPVLAGQVTSKFGAVALSASLDGGAYVPLSLSSDGSFTDIPGLATDGSADGSHTVVFIATDPTGLLSGPVSYQFVLDTQPATITLAADSVQNGGVLTSGAMLAGSIMPEAGDAVAAISYSFDGAFAGSISPETASAFSQALDLSRLAAGQHTLTLTVTDISGLVSTDTLAVDYQPGTFSLLSITPINSQTEIGVTYRPEIKFSRPVDASSVTASSFYATDSTGAVIPAAIVVEQDGSAARLLFTQPLAGSSTVTLHVDGALIQAAGDGALLDAAGSGTPGTTLTDSYVTVSTTGVPGTTLSGIVVDPGPDGVPYSPDDLKAAVDGTNDWANDQWKLPIAGAKVYILGLENEAVYTDATGHFTLTDVPSGDVKLVVEGRTATNAPAGYFFPQMVTDLNVTPGVANTAMADMGSADQRASNAGNPAIYLPRVADDAMTPLSATTPTVVTAPTDSSLGAGTFTLTPAQLAQVQLAVAPGSLVDASGNAVAAPTVGISPVPPAIVQDMLPPGVLQHTFDITIQAGDGAIFTQPAVLTLPNVFGLAAGEKTYMLDFDHTTGRLEVQGTATVSADGQTVTSDPNSGVSMPGWHGMTPALTHAKGGVNVPCPDAAAISAAQLNLSEKGGAYASDITTEVQGLDAAIGSDLIGGTSKFTGAAGNVANAAGVFLDARSLVNDASQNFADAKKDGFFSLSTAIFVLQGIQDTANLTLSTVGAIGSKVPVIGAEVGTVATIGRGASAFTSALASSGPDLTDALNGLSTAQAANPCPPGSTSASPQTTMAITEAASATADMTDASATASTAQPAAAPLTGDIAADIAAAQAETATINQIAADAQVLAPIDALDFTQSDLGLTASQNAALFANIDADQAAYTDMLTQTESLQGMPTLLALANDIYNSVVNQANTDLVSSSMSLQGDIDDYNAAILDEAAYANSCDNAPPGTVCEPDPELLVEAAHEHALADAGFATIGGLNATLYAALQGPDGNIQRFTFNYTAGIDYFLTPSTEYTLTVYDPAVNKVGSVDFMSAVSGETTTLPNVTLFTDTGAAGADGLSSTAAFVLGLDNTQSSNLVAGESDLAALQQPGGAVTLASQSGVVASLALPGSAVAVTLAGNLNDPAQLTAYVALGTAGLAVVDVSKLLSPVLLGSVATGGTAVGVAEDDLTGLVAVADTSNLAIVDVTGTPMVTATLAIAAIAVVALNGTAYVAAGSTIDVVDMSAGLLVQRLTLGGTVTALARDGHYLYAIDSGGTLHVMDLDTPSLAQVGSVSVPVDGSSLTVGNGVAYVGNASGTITGGYATVDVSNPLAPVVIAAPQDGSIAAAGIALAGPGMALAVQSFSLAGPPVGFVDVLNTADPTNTANRDTRYTLTGQQAYGVAIGNGVAFVADGTGLAVVNYAAADTTGIAPTVSITQLPADIDPSTPGIQAYEGEAITLGVQAADNIQVRNTELLVNGAVVENAVSYPFSLGTVLPTIAANGSTTVTLQVETFDTGGNSAMSAPVTVQLVPDTRPLVLLSQSVNDGAHLGLSLRDITFSFSKPLAASVAMAMPVTITAPDGTMVMASTMLTGGGRVLEVDFTPTQLGAYTVSLDGPLVQDVSGNVSAPSESFGFTLQTFTDTFTNTDGGDWNTAANWSTGAVPGPADTAFIGGDVAGPVTYDSGTSAITSLTMDQAAILDLNGGSLEATGGSYLTAVEIDGGTLIVDAPSTAIDLAQSSGLLDAAGTLTVTTDFAWTGGTVSGTAGVVVGGAATMEVTQNATLAGTLSLQGSGSVTEATLQIGNGTPGVLTIVSGGTLTLSGGAVAGDGTAGDALVNDGTLTAGPESVLRSVTVDGSGGGVIAPSGQLELQSATISGGTLSTAAGGVIDTADRGTVLQNVAIATGTTFTVGNNTSVNIAGTIANAGIIALDSTGNYTSLNVVGATTLSGTLQLTDNGQNDILSNGAAATLTNTQLIEGSGYLGNNDADFTLVNQGTLDATGSSNALVLNTNANVVTNTGILEDTAIAGLLIQNTAVANATGMVLAQGAGSHVDLQSATITGGTLQATGGGAIDTTDRGTVLQNVAITTGTTVTVSNNTSLNIGGTIANAGIIALASGGNYTSLNVVGATTLSGTLQLSDNSQNVIVSNGATATLTNTQIIEGSGYFGNNDGNFTLVNQGTLDATGSSNALVLNTNANVVTNTGTLEDTGTAGLLIQNTAVANANATVLAQGAGSHVDLQGTSITGGTLQTTDGGVIDTTDRGTVLQNVAIAADTTITVNNNTSLTIAGPIANAGVIALASTGNYTSLNVVGATTLTGTVQLSDNSQNVIVSNGAAATLTDTQLIEGSGAVGNNDGNFTLVNQGTLDATGSANALVLNTNANVVTNTGTIEDTGAAGLLIQNTSVNNANGTVLAQGTGSHVDLQSATITGGTLQATGGGEIDTIDRGTILQNVAIAAGTTVTVNNNTSLNIGGTIANGSVIAMEAAGNYTSLIVAGATTLSGILQSSDNTQNAIVSNGAAATLTNTQLIEGSGTVGNNDGNFTLVNQGTLDATGAANALVLNTNVNVVTNTGTLEDTGAAGLLIQNISIANANGTVLAQGAGAHVDLQSASITGGAVSTTGGGVIDTIDRGTVLQGLSITGATAVMVNNNTSLTLANSTVSASATVSLLSNGNFTALNIGGQVTIAAGAVLSLSDNSQNDVVVSGTAGTLLNSGTITGAGALGNNSALMLLNNAVGGVIDASGANALTLNFAGGTVTNAGLIESVAAGVSSAGVVVTNTTIDDTANDNGGQLLASGVGSRIDLQSATILGGTLTTTAGGLIDTLDRGSLLQNVAIATGTVVTVDNNTSLMVGGTITGPGGIALNSAGNETVLAVVGQTTLADGTLQLSDNGQNYITSNGAAATLTNTQLIEGSGYVGGGDSNFTLINQATLDATGTVSAIILNTSTNIVTNTGTIEDTGTAGLAIVNTSVANAGGAVVAQGAGSHVDLQSATITDGSLQTGGAGVIDTLDRGSKLQSVAIGLGASVTVNNNTSLTLAGGTLNEGVITLASTGNFTNLSIAGNTTLSGNGSLTLSDNGQNNITSNGVAATLTNAGNTIAGGGQLGDDNLTLQNQATIDATGANALTINTAANTLTNTGTLEATGAGGLAISGSGGVANSGLIWADGGNVAISAAVTGTGLGRISGSATLEFGAAVSAGQTITFAAGATGTLKLDQSVASLASVSGLATDGSNTLDLADIVYGGSTNGTLSGTTASSTLQVTDGTRTADVTLLGNYTGAIVHLATDSSGHTLVSLTV